MPVKVRSAIVCDQVRTEDNGKQLLIGVYLGDVRFKSFPAYFMPTFWIQVEPWVQHGPMHFEIKVEFPGHAPIIAPQVLDIREEPSALLIARGTKLLKIDGPGILRFSIRQPGGRWTEALSLPISLETGQQSLATAG